VSRVTTSSTVRPALQRRGRPSRRLLGAALMVLLGALLVFAQGSALAPFIYTIF